MNLKPIAANQTEVELENGTTVFFSYKTPVAAHIQGEGFVKTEKYWSRTTSKHIGQFVARNGGRTADTRPQSFFDALA
jgi:hypothetical protein